MGISRTTEQALERCRRELPQLIKVWEGDPLQTVEQLTQMITTLETARDEAVLEARRGGSSWSAIGHAAAMARQSAWTRWRKGGGRPNPREQR